MADDYSNADRFLSSMKDSRDSDRRGGDRHRGSRYDDRDYDRFRRDDRDRRDRDRDRPPRDRDGGGRSDDRRGPRHDDDRRRDYRVDRGPRHEDVSERAPPPPPRHRDEDRGGFGGGRGRERGGRRERDDTERRSPTPDGCVPLSKRKRKASGWDVHAPGYEQYTALQAKQTGLFNLPGANRIQVPPILSIPGLPTPVPVPTFGMGVGGNPNLARQSRRLYIGSITPEINEQNLAQFFNAKMKEMNIGTGVSGDPVLAVQVNYEKNYAFVEFRSAEDATAAMAFDGIMFLSVPLKIRRPKDYAGNDLMPGAQVPGVVSTNVPDSINKIFVGGLPTYLNEEQVMELLKSFGELKAFNLVRDNGTGPSKGFAFFEYVDPSVTDIAIQGLNGMELADRYLVVQRASIGAKGGTGMIPNPLIPADAFPTSAPVPKPIMPAGDTASEVPDARILLMLNMVTPDDLINDQDFEDIFMDVKEECENYGKVVDLRIPRPVKKDKSKWAPGEGGAMAAADAARADEAAGVGRVYVKYEDVDGAAAALKSLAGRSFAGRSIIATLLSENSQTTPPLHIIFSEQPPQPPPPPPE